MPIQWAKRCCTSLLNQLNNFRTKQKKNNVKWILRTKNFTTTQKPHIIYSKTHHLFSMRFANITLMQRMRYNSGRLCVYNVKRCVWLWTFFLAKFYYAKYAGDDNYSGVRANYSRMNFAARFVCAHLCSIMSQ